MSDIENMVDKFSGFITKEQAEFILKSDSDSQSKHVPDQRKSTVTITELLDDIAIRKKSNVPEIAEEDSVVNVKDYVYRIFNPQEISIKGRNSKRRTVILGPEGSTMALNLKDKLSDFIDINLFERGDMVAVNNAVLDRATGELKSNANTIINRIAPSKQHCIIDYSSIKEDTRKVDILGRIIEISPIRHVSRLGRPEQIAVSSCTITDTVNVIDASFWGSSALITAQLKTNDVVKMEFCDIRTRDGKMQISVNDDSRVVPGGTFSARLLAKK